MYTDNSTITATGTTAELVETALSKDLDDITMWYDSNAHGPECRKDQGDDDQDSAEMQHLKKKELNLFSRDQKLEVVEGDRLLGLYIVGPLPILVGHY